MVWLKCLSLSLLGLPFFALFFNSDILKVAIGLTIALFVAPISTELYQLTVSHKLCQQGGENESSSLLDKGRRGS